jgi:hypothetical protein
VAVALTTTTAGAAHAGGPYVTHGGPYTSYSDPSVTQGGPYSTHGDVYVPQGQGLSTED